jgi:glucosamine 6-phosphate synthetase-like amidotransferase/phosphosugar isomerase protein
MKKVGAPSIVTEELEIAKRVGKKFVGQVRWATYGAVTDENAQPHEVNCVKHMVGAHNGNISNTDALKDFLIDNGHRVVSDNDGEILVHLIEHYYAKNSAGISEMTHDDKINAFKNSVRNAQKKVMGSYAACFTAPDIEGVFAIKSGSSLYAGKGKDANGEFIVVSSDLTSVLSKTRFLIPLTEGEGIYFTHNDYVVFSLTSTEEHKPGLKRTRLNISDIALQPRFSYFMEQEIHTSAGNIDVLIKYYLQEKQEAEFHDYFEENYTECRELLYDLVKLYGIFDNREFKQAFLDIIESSAFIDIFEKVKSKVPGIFKDCYSLGFTSEDAPLLNELLGIGEKYFQQLYMIDLLVIWKKKRTIVKFKNKLIQILKDAGNSGRRIYLVASGTSYHASLIAAYFMGNLAGISIITANPGMFRSIHLPAILKDDIVIGVTQSGETKDLVDIFNDLRNKYGKEIRLISIVNNENSTIPQEKSNFYLPILCGSEIAVAATKSFTSQMALFYLLALSINETGDNIKNELQKVKHFIDYTIKSTDEGIANAVFKLYLKPSIHILGTSLIGLALEGALKIREVVLNHTEGYDSAEFKHGPNTILGKNTIYSLSDMEKLHSDLTGYISTLLDKKSLDNSNLREFLNLLKDFKFNNLGGKILSGQFEQSDKKQAFADAYAEYREKVDIENYFSNYPLIFICPPNERDKRITISQIHTHKIRGADIIMIAEDDAELRMAVEGKPMGAKDYLNIYIKIPKTGNPCIFGFQAAIVLQLMALNMSIIKRKYLNKNKIDDHGVHPDVPKNVSKSITVD